MEIIRIGYYSVDDIWFNINEFNGFPSHPYPSENTQIVALIRDDKDNNNEWPVEINITHKQAEFLEQMYNILKK